MENLKTIKDLSEILNCAEITIRRLIKGKKIPYRKLGSRYLFHDTDIAQILASAKVEPVAQEVKNAVAE
jgi:excisionase family DNA binding protein